MRGKRKRLGVWLCMQAPEECEDDERPKSLYLRYIHVPPSLLVGLWCWRPPCWWRPPQSSRIPCLVWPAFAPPSMDVFVTFRGTGSSLAGAKVASHSLQEEKKTSQLQIRWPNRLDDHVGLHRLVRKSGIFRSARGSFLKDPPSAPRGGIFACFFCPVRWCSAALSTRHVKKFEFEAGA